MTGKSMADGTRAVFRSPAAILFEINFTAFVVCKFLEACATPNRGTH